METKNIIFYLQQQARSNPNCIALVNGKDLITYRKLFELAMKAAAFFANIGVKPSDVVVLSFRDELFYALSIFALASLGSTTLCVPISTPGHKKYQYIQQAKCSRFFTDGKFELKGDVQWEIINLTHFYTFSAKSFSFVERPSAHLMLAIGSGSTGLNKLMPISHQAMIERCEMAIDDPVLQPNSRLLCMSSLAYISVANRLFNAIRSSTTFVLLESRNDDIFEFIRKNSVNTLVLSVFHLEELLRKSHSNSLNYFQKHIQAIRCVGSLLSEDLKRRVFENLNENIVNSYATNETGVISRTSLPIKFDGLPNVGFPLSGVKVEVVDATDRVLDFGKRGYIRISTPGLIDQYLYNEIATKKAFREGGWFYPGDIGEFNSNGSLLFHGRSDRMMIHNGINIFPVEIEETLTSHPAVLDCVAFPIKDTESQDIPVCAVSLKSSSHPSEEELIQWSVERLGISYPRRIFILETIPKTIEGKIQLLEVLDIVRSRIKNMKL